MWFTGFAAMVMTFVMIAWVSSFCQFVITILLGPKHLTVARQTRFNGLTVGVFIFTSGLQPEQTNVWFVNRGT